MTARRKHPTITEPPIKPATIMIQTLNLTFARLHVHVLLSTSSLHP